MVPEQFVLVAVSVFEVKPKLERQPEDCPACAAAVTVKPAGKVTVRVPERVFWRVKVIEAVADAPALIRLKVILLLRVGALEPPPESDTICPMTSQSADGLASKPTTMPALPFLTTERRLTSVSATVSTPTPLAVHCATPPASMRWA